MSGADDYEDEMFRRFDLDDDTVDVILSGRDPGRTDAAMLVAFAEDARSVTRRPAPVPSAPLAAILAERLSTEKSDLLVTAASNVHGPANQAAGLPKWRKKKVAVGQLRAGLSLGAKAALGIGVAAAAVTGAGAAGALPGPAQHAVASTVNAVTPFAFPDNANTHADNANTHAEFGKTVSSDATGTSDGQPGVDGQSVSSNARAEDDTASDGQPGDEGQSTASTAPDNGLSVAGQTPAGDHVPSSVPPESAPNGANDNSSNVPSDPGSQSSNGIDTASSTPAGDHVAPVPPPHS